MATVTSLTADKIIELMAGWEAVSDRQDETDTLVSSLNTALASYHSALDSLVNTTMPALQAQVAAGDIAVGDLVDNVIPNLQTTLAAHDLDLVNLNTVYIPGLQTQLDSNSSNIDDLLNITLPGLDDDLAALQGLFPVTGENIAADTITANNILADTITANEIAAATITAAEIAVGTITALQIAVDTITANEIAADTITANEIAADTITANEIAADTITANEIAADTITANEIAADTITAELIAADAVTANAIAADVIVGEHIAAGTLTGDLFVSEMTLSTRIVAADLDDETGEIVGGWSEMSPQGLYTIDSTGSPVFSTPTDAANGAYLKAHLDLLSADVRDFFTMHGTNNALAVGSELQLSAGVVAPTAPPVLVETWDTVQLDKNTAVPPHVASTGYDLGTFSLNPSQITSIDWDATWNCWLVLQQKTAGFRVWRFNADGSIKNNLGSGNPWVDDFNDRAKASVCYDPVGGGAAMLFKLSGSWFLWGFDTSGNGVINTIPAFWIIDNDDRPPTLGWDPVNSRYIIAQNNGGGSGTIHIRRFHCVSGGSFPNAVSDFNNNFEAESGWSKRLNGIVAGTQLTGSGLNYAVSCDDYLGVATFNSSGVQYNDDGSYRNWYKAEACLGFGHNGTQFASVGATGKITLYSDWTWLESDRMAWTGLSAFDSDTAGDQANPHTGQTAGQHETPVGTFASINLSRRSKLRITVPETSDAGGDDDPDKWNVYFKRGGATAPTDSADLDLVASIGSPTSPTYTTLSADPTGVSPPGGIRGQIDEYNNFPGGIPASIESQAEDVVGPIIKLQGSGAGRTGPYRWNSDGEQVDGDPTYDTGWVSGWAGKGGSSPFPNTSATTINYAEYRRVGNLVHVRGSVSLGAAYTPANPNHSNQVILTGLPAEVCPNRTVNVTADCSDMPIMVYLYTGGNITWVGSAQATTYAQGQNLNFDVQYLIEPA